MVVRAGNPRPTTAGERLFATYLCANGIDFEFEPLIAGKRKRPDFLVRLGNNVATCEVKDLHRKRPLPGGAVAVNPYASIRDEIDESRRKFGEFKDRPCILVLHNVDDWQFSHYPPILFGAMLGDLGISFQVADGGRKNPPPPTETRSVFLHSGKMLYGDPRRTESHARIQNTTISAVAVVSEFDVRNPAFDEEFARRLRVFRERTGRKPSDSEWIQIRIEQSDEIDPVLRTVPRVVAAENPFARVPLPSSMFNGSCDERYRYCPSRGVIERVFAGSDLVAAEQVAPGDVMHRLERFRAALLREFQPAKVILFGSQAAGTARPDSDVDLLVVFPGDGDLSHRSLDIRRRIPCDFPLDLVVRSEGELKRRLMQGDTFLQSILDDGRVIYAA